MAGRRRRVAIPQCLHYRYGMVSYSTRIAQGFYTEPFGRVIWMMPYEMYRRLNRLDAVP